MSIVPYKTERAFTTRFIPMEETHETQLKPLAFKRHSREIEINHIDNDGDIEIRIQDSEETAYFFLTEKETAELIAFLQKQLED